MSARVSGVEPARVLVHIRDAALQKSVRDQLLLAGFAVHCEPNLDTLALALGLNRDCLLVMEADPDGVTWLGTSDAELRQRAVLLAPAGERASLDWHPRVVAWEHLDRLAAELQSLQAASRGERLALRDEQPRPSGTLLIVDDDAAVRELLSQRLEARNYHCTTAGDGEEAIQRIRLEVPDLILLDLNMPGMDGMEFLRLARKHINHAFGVIVMTGGGSEEIREQAGRFGAFAVVRKPINFPELLRLIDIQLDYRRLRSRLRDQ